MNIIISNSSAVPLYEQIQNQIKTQILNVEVKADEHLPSIRSLAKELKVSIITTKRAYEELEKEGYIVTVAGKGSYVCGQSIERLKEAGVEESNIFITKNQGTIWLKSDGNSIIIEKLKELNLDGANKVSYRSIFDICSYFFIKIS